jgi:glyoxylase-like metal-dependent hydrolase (beta-lactamase superfamily II)
MGKECASIEIIDIAPGIILVDPQPPIPGFNKFIASYLLLGERTAIVDPGPAAAIPGLLSGLTEVGLKREQVDYVVLTHIHLDHAGGIGALIASLPRAMVIVHNRAISHLVNPGPLWDASLKTLGRLAVQYGQVAPIPESRIIPAADLMELNVGGGLTPQIYLTPGHAVHHLSLFERSHRILFAGEAAGVCINGTIRPATPPPFKLEVTVASIDRLMALGPARLCYGHFGCYGDAVNRLKLYRDKLVSWYNAVRRQAGHEKTPEDILMLMRQKDTDLDYLDKLDSDTFAREYTFLLNSIHGMMGSIP